MAPTSKSTTAKPAARKKAPSKKAVPPQVSTTPKRGIPLDTSSRTKLTPEQVASRAKCLTVWQRIEADMTREQQLMVIRKFGSPRVGFLSQLKPEQYEAFAQHCEAELALWEQIKKSIPSREYEITQFNPAPMAKHLRDAANAIESGKWKYVSGGMLMSYCELDENVKIKSDLVLAPNPDYKAKFDEDHPLWLVNEQIKGLLEGLGANEDHEAVVSFLRATGLPEDTVNRIHKAIVFGDTKVVPTARQPLFNDDLHRAITEGEQRKLILQTEAAINLGIGFVLKSLGQSEIAVHPEALKNFTTKYCVAQHVADDGSFLIEVKER